MKQKYAAALTNEANGQSIKPHFFKGVLKAKGKKDFYDFDRKTYLKFNTSMDYLNTVVDRRKAYRPSTPPEPIIPFSEVLDKSKYKKNCVNVSKLNRIIGEIEAYKTSHDENYANPSLDFSAKSFMDKRKLEGCIAEINTQSLNYSTMYKLLLAIEDEKRVGLRWFLFDSLFASHDKLFFDAIMRSREPIEYLVEDSAGDIELFGVNYAKVVFSKPYAPLNSEN